MKPAGSLDRGRVASGLRWIGAGSLVLTIHAGAVTALIWRSEPSSTAMGGEPALEVDLEPVEGEKADETAPQSSGDPTTASTAAADTAAAAVTETPLPVTPQLPEPHEDAPVPPPPPKPAEVAPLPSPAAVPPKVDPIPTPPEPPAVDPVPAPPPEPAKVLAISPKTTPQTSHASSASAAAEAADERSPAVQKLSGGRVATWRGQLVAHLNRFRHFPPGLGSGTTRVGFTIDATGRVTATDVVSGSGSAALDAAALALVEHASPFPAPPAGVSGKGLTFVVPIHFDGQRS